jgi:hypothetical protein
MSFSRTQVEPISPYAKNLSEFIDTEIHDLVMIFLAKGYLTVSSCQGHHPWQARYIILAFGKTEHRESLIHILQTFKTKPLLTLEKMETTSIESIDQNTTHWQTRENEVKGFNQMFMRTYNEYFFLRITIGKSVIQKNLENQSYLFRIYLDLKSTFYGFHNFFFRNRSTKLFQQDVADHLPNFVG